MQTRNIFRVVFRSIFNNLIVENEPCFCDLNHIFRFHERHGCVSIWKRKVGMPKARSMSFCNASCAFVNSFPFGKLSFTNCLIFFTKMAHTPDILHTLCSTAAYASDYSPFRGAMGENRRRWFVPRFWMCPRLWCYSTIDLKGKSQIHSLLWHMASLITLGLPSCPFN